ncbi:MAG: CoB--CoM heterodisulfide reductase subunit B [Acidobacteria bacterium]|nr:CoB--CoM heterodisulfide reductase subunit B [Acidobacteriota bacterium]
MSAELRVTPFFGCMISMKLPQFEAAVRRTVDKLGVELVDLEGFACCPDPLYYKTRDKMTWLILAARNLCVAEDAGLDIVTCCSGCTATLSEARAMLTEDEALCAEVNGKLKAIGREFKGTIQVKHIATLIREEIGLEKVRDSVTHPLTDLKVAIHYGCHLLKPSHIMQVDDPDHPTILEELIRAVGATPLNHEEKLLCCGKACNDPDLPPKMLLEVMRSVNKLDVHCMALICPTCFDSFDFGQIKLKRMFDEEFHIPVVYYFQLLALAQGIAPAEVGLHWHKIKTDNILEVVGAENA